MADFYTFSRMQWRLLKYLGSVDNLTMVFSAKNPDTGWTYHWPYRLISLVLFISQLLQDQFGA